MRIKILNILVIIQYSLLLIYGSKMDFESIFYIGIIIILLLNLTDINLLWKNHKEKSGQYFKRNNYYGFLILLSIMLGTQLNV